MPTTTEHKLIQAVRVLDSERSTTLLLLAGEASWLRSSTATLFNEMADARMLEHAYSTEVARHATGLGRHLEQLKAQNAYMQRLQHLAEELGVWNQWPSSVQVVVTFVEKSKQLTKKRKKPTT
jgi:hypothetical protein